MASNDRPSLRDVATLMNELLGRWQTSRGNGERKMTAVLADDSIIVRDRVKAYLRFAGYDVLAACKNGREAVDACKEHKPDVAVLDISMPVMNGDAAALEIQRANLAKHVVVATSQIQDATLAPIHEAGIGVIAKPFYQDKFVKELRAIVDGDAP